MHFAARSSAAQTLSNSLAPNADTPQPRINVLLFSQLLLPQPHHAALPEAMSTMEKHRSANRCSEASPPLLAEALKSRRGAQRQGPRGGGQEALAAAATLINLPDLHEALNSPTSSTTCGVLRGRLLPAVRSELRARRHAEWKKALPLTRILQNEQPWKPPPKLLRKLEVVRGHDAALGHRPALANLPRARLHHPLGRNGAQDEHPLGHEPTFGRQRWYLSQFDFPNGRDLREIEKVTIAGTTSS